MIDSSSIRVHQHGANAKKKDGGSDCIGRSRGGLTTKIPAVVDADGLPITLKLKTGQAHDGPVAHTMVGTVGHEQILLADRAYDSDALRHGLKERGAWANIKPKSNRKQAPVFCAYLYKQRNLVERFFNKIKNFRAVATRYDKLDANYLAGVKLASTRIWPRANESVA
jgi:transposase